MGGPAPDISHDHLSTVLTIPRSSAGARTSGQGQILEGHQDMVCAGTKAYDGGLDSINGLGSMK